MKELVSVDFDKHDELPNFIQANAEELPFKDGRFDTAALCEILEHVENPTKALQEAVRVSKRVIITVPYEHEWDEQLDPMLTIEDKEKKHKKTRQQLLKEEGKIPFEKFNGTDNYDHLWHHRFYTPESLKKELEDAGITNYTLVKLRTGVWAHLGVVIG